MESIVLDSKDRSHWLVEPLIFGVAKTSEALTEKDIINVPSPLEFSLSSSLRYAETGHAPSTRMKRIDVEIPPIEDLIGFLEMNRR